jgi:hypothetical protein
MEPPVPLVVDPEEEPEPIDPRPVVSPIVPVDPLEPLPMDPDPESVVDPWLLSLRSCPFRVWSELVLELPLVDPVDEPDPSIVPLPLMVPVPPIVPVPPMDPLVPLPDDWANTGAEARRNPETAQMIAFFIVTS